MIIWLLRDEQVLEMSTFMLYIDEKVLTWIPVRYSHLWHLTEIKHSESFCTNFCIYRQAEGKRVRLVEYLIVSERLERNQGGLDGHTRQWLYGGSRPRLQHSSLLPSTEKASRHNIKLPFQIKSATPYLECFIQAIKAFWVVVIVRTQLTVHLQILSAKHSSSSMQCYLTTDIILSKYVTLKQLRRHFWDRVKRLINTQI